MTMIDVGVNLYVFPLDSFSLQLIHRPLGVINGKKRNNSYWLLGLVPYSFPEHNPCVY